MLRIMLIRSALIIGIMMFGVGCGNVNRGAESDTTVGPSAVTSEPAFDVAETVGLYFESSEPPFDVDQMLLEVLAAEGTASGEHFGIAAVSRSVVTDDVIGYRIEFRQERLDTMVSELVSEARALGFTVAIVAQGSVWPDCVGEDDCDRGAFVP